MHNARRIICNLAQSRKISALLLLIGQSQIVSWNFRKNIYKILGADIRRGSLIGYRCDFAGPIRNLRMRENTYVNHSCFIGIEAELIIEEGARIGPYVKIMTRWHPIESKPMRREVGKDFDLPKKIGRGSWIGISTIILPGVDIADGCVVAAGSVVVKSTEPNGLYAGVPARRIRDL